MPDSDKKTTRKTLTPNATLVKIFSGILAGMELTVVLLFGAAGRLDWPLGWLYVAVWCLLKLVFIILLRWHDPDLMYEVLMLQKELPGYTEYAQTVRYRLFPKIW